MRAFTQQATRSRIQESTSSTALRARRGNAFLARPSATGSAISHFTHDFSRISVEAPAVDTGQRIQHTAEEGTQGSAGWFPHLDAIQRSFGRHEVSDVAAHQGLRAQAAANAIGASAYTLGDRVAFSGSPDLHTAAHEAAHVVQQRAGIKIAGGAGAAGDVYERHADAVADRVVRGQSSEDLLDAYRPGFAGWTGSATPGGQRATRGAAANVVQKKTLTTTYGTFQDVAYHKLTNARDEEIGCEMYLRFTPGNTVDATQIGLTQAIKPTKEGSLDPADATKQAQAVTSGTGTNVYIDQYAGTRNPLYATSNAPASNADKIEAWSAGPKVTPMSRADQQTNAAAGVKGVKYDGIGQHGFRKQSGTSWVTQPAELDDWPTRPGSVGAKDSGQYFETTALAIEGTQKDSYYGSVQWGWQRDGAGKFSLVDFKIVSMGTPSANFMAAAQKWNTSQTSGGEATIPLPTVKTYKTMLKTDVGSGKAKITLPLGTRVQVISKGAAPADPWQVKIADGPMTGKMIELNGGLLVEE